MELVGSIGFASPLLLTALAALPVIWWLLRATPPAPVRRIFPAVGLLAGLKDEDSTPDRTPWWLLALRMAALAALIVGFAGPVLNPRAEQLARGPLLVVIDGGVHDARDWPLRFARMEEEVAAAGRRGRPVAILNLSAPPPGGEVSFRDAGQALDALRSLQPAPHAPGIGQAVEWLRASRLPDAFDTLWFSDGLDHDTRRGLAAALAARGTVRVIESDTPVVALAAPVLDDGAIRLTGTRRLDAIAHSYRVDAIGPDPSGTERVLASGELAFGTGDNAATLRLSLPTELRNRISRFRVAGTQGAAAVALVDDGLRRRKVLLVAGGEDTEAEDLLSPLHYLRQALSDNAEVLEFALGDGMAAAPDTIILADVAGIAGADRDRLVEWVEGGGTLIRFAGPRLAAHSAQTRTETADDPLMPVRLRIGGRSVGGTMSWGAPRGLKPFPADTPFFGLAVPDEVDVTAQVVAEPGPDLAARVIATLDDGTPLVTRKSLGQGRVVLFHVTANAEWSSLPLSGLFIGMLERLTAFGGAGARDAAVIAGASWQMTARLDAFGVLDRIDDGERIDGEVLLRGASREAGPGLYESDGRAVALNAVDAAALPGAARWPDGVAVERFGADGEVRLAGWLLAAALVLLSLDVLATLHVSGLLRKGAGVAAMVLAGLLAAPQVDAQDGPSFDEADALKATEETVLAYVLTGDASVDRLSAAGLTGLGLVLYARTSVEPVEPVGIDLERDELALFPMLYWPITEAQATPSEAAYDKLNRYLRGGGLILFDTRDANLGGSLFATPNARRLRTLAAPLAIPPLEPIPEDHVLTRAFYLLQDFPGRHAGAQVWVEAAPADAVQVPGLPFRNLNDGVTPVVIGGNDWASAWATDEDGNYLYPVGRGSGGERQREIAFRFGVNLVMHVLTGNYKSDQVHVPALLERLGQ